MFKCQVIRTHQTEKPVGAKRSQGHSSSYNPKSISPAQRVKEFPDECLTVSAGRLFCKACREEIGLKSTTIRLHIKSAKHCRGKESLNERMSKDKDIAQAFETYIAKENPAGETLSKETQVYRIRVVTTFLRAGVALNKLDLFRPLLEENGYRLAGRRTMSDLIPFIHEQEVSTIAQEIQGKNISIIFDGTTRMGEALAIVVRFITDDFKIQQRLVRMQFLAKSVCGDELAREIISILQVSYKVSPTFLLGAMHDRASVNNAAMGTVKIVFPQVLDIGCFSHTVDLVGDKFVTPNLDEFISAWIQLFSHSPKSKLLWVARNGKAIKTYCKTRWWSKWEVIDQAMSLFGDIEPFLVENADLAQRTRSKLLAFLQNPQQKCALMIEMAVVVDAGRVFVKSTYNMEGDGPLVLTAYENIQSAFESINVRHYPNVDAVVAQVVPPQMQNQWKDYAMTCIKPATDFF